MDMPIEFDGVIEAARGGGACIPVPFDTRKVFGTGRSVRVDATYDGFAAKSSVVSMGGRAVLGIHKATRTAIAKGPGDAVHVTLVADAAPRVVAVPRELADELDRDPKTRALYEALAYTYRKEFAAWVANAKKQETRDSRAARAVEKIRAGVTL